MLAGGLVIDTDWLTHARFVPTAPLRVRQRWLAVGAVLLLIGAGYGFFGDLFMKARDVAALREARESLAAEVERLQTELAVENATRQELERHSEELNARVAELDGQVKFLKARRAPARAPAPAEAQAQAQASVKSAE